MKSGASLQKLGPTKRAILISHHNPPGRGEGEAKKKEGEEKRKSNEKEEEEERRGIL